MALPFTSQVEATTLNLLESGAEDNIYDSASLFYHLREMGQITASGGSQIQSVIEYQKLAAGGSYQGADILSTQPTDSSTAAVANWKLYYVHVVITKQDILRNSGDEAVVDLIQTKTKNAHLKMADLISTDLFSTNGDSATGVTGMRNLISTSTTHHSISPTDFSNWIADTDTTDSAIALSTIETHYLNATIGSDNPDIAVTTKPVYRKIWSLLQSNQRFGGEQTAAGGFKYILFNDIPIFHDSHCPGTGAGTADSWLFFMNSRHMNFYVHKDDNFTVEKIPPPANQAIRIWRLGATCNYLFRNRRMFSGFSVLKP
jgi:hypothetical protein